MFDKSVRVYRIHTIVLYIVKIIIRIINNIQWFKYINRTFNHTFK